MTRGAAPASAMRVILADDEPNAREGLQGLLSGDPELHVVAVCASGTEAADAIARTAPDIALLDIHMPGRDGLEVLAGACGAVPAVILVTAYAEHALSAFEAHALDYLLKPFSDARFADAIGRAKQRVREHRLSRGAPPPYAERLLASVGRRSVVVPVEDVDWIEGADYYARLHVGQRAYFTRESLAALSARLDPTRFARVHRSAIVNLARVQLLRRRAGGACALLLRDGTSVAVSRRRRREIERALGKAS